MKDPKAEEKAAKMKNPDWRLYSGWPPEATAEPEPEKRKPGRPRKEAPVEEVTPDGDSHAN
mgnify:CR=1 FL=1